MEQMYNPAEIKKAAEEMKTQGTQLQKLINQMSSIVSEMGTVWQSEAQRAFASKFNEIEPELSAYVKKINAYADRAIAQAEAIIRSETPV